MPSPGRFRTVILAAALGAGTLTGGAATPAGAAITNNDFPSASTVRTIMAGSGSWSRHLSRSRPLGAKPSACRSDRPLAGASEFRTAYYSGPLRGTRVWGTDDLQVHRFATRAGARRAMARLRSFVTDCATSVEWVCTQCDGVWSIRRYPSATRPVGDLAWRERSEGMGVASIRAIAARSGRTVVIVRVGRESMPDDPFTPAAPTWAQTQAVARAAIRAAT